MTNQAFGNGSPEAMALLFALSIAVSLIAVLVALDSHERGNPKTTSILWFFAIQLFVPVALIYLYARNRKHVKRPEKQAVEALNCPYCNEPYNKGDRMCSRCGRIL